MIVWLMEVSKLYGCLQACLWDNSVSFRLVVDLPSHCNSGS